jgi:cytochrome c peroxidase
MMSRKLRWLSVSVGSLLACSAILAADLTPMEQLGKNLFFDTNLSTPPGQSCAACHDPGTAFAGPNSDINEQTGVYPGAIHTRAGARKPPSAAYMSFSPAFHYDEAEGLYVGGNFWDGRANSTFEQAKGPFLNPVEQNNPNKKSVVIKVMNSDYSQLFSDVFLNMNPNGNAIAPNQLVEQMYDQIALAIAAYEASVEVNRFSSKFDAYLQGLATLTSQEAWGFELFEGKAMCSACHISEVGPNGEPPLFTDFTYDNLGVPKNPGNPFYTMPRKFNPDGVNFVDYGLGGRLGIAEEMGKFKVPTLRNVGMSPYEGFVQAYMHNGVFKSLHEVVEFYSTRDVADWPEPEVPMNVNVDELGDLGLTSDEVDALVAFMNTLTDGWMDMMLKTQPLVLNAGFGLLGNSPNPFNPTTQISFRVPTSGQVRLEVFNVRGQKVAVLTDQRLDAGLHQVTWNAGNTSSGTYYLRLLTPGLLDTRRLQLVK